jgi:uncharacterized protein (DUF58 family)
MSIKNYLTATKLASFKKFEMIAHSVVEGFVSGFHESPYKGFAIEFAEHREYTPGDDLKHLDWKMLAKTDRYYIKQYEEDTSLTAYMLLDVSGSMGYQSGTFQKLDFGKFICGVFSYLLLQQNDSIGLMTFDSKIRDFLPARTSKPHFRRIFDLLDGVKPGYDTGLGEVLHLLANRLKRRALIVIVSDFYDNFSDIERALSHFSHKKHEVIVFQVIDRQELNFEFSSLTRFESLETEQFNLVDPLRLKREYQRQFNQHQKALQKTCHRLHIDYVNMITDEKFESSIAKYLAGRLRR